MKKLLILFLVGMSAFAQAQTDHIFWFAPPFITYFHNPPGGTPIYLRMAAGDLAADVTVAWPANLSSTPITRHIPPRGSASIRLDSLFAWDGATGNLAANEFLTYPPAIPVPYGMYIRSTTDISVYYQIDNNNNRDIYSLKGQNALGSEFYVPFQNRFDKYTGYSDNSASIDIVATEDNTTVDIILPNSYNDSRAYPPDASGGAITYSSDVTDSKDREGAVIHASGTTWFVTLQKGQSYSIRAASSNATHNYMCNLGGTIIKARNGKKIAVNITDDSVRGKCGCWNVIGDQLVPVEMLGSKYIVTSSKLIDPNTCSPAPTTYPWAHPMDGWCFITPAANGAKIYVNEHYDTTLNLGGLRAVKVPDSTEYAMIKAVDASGNPVKICILHIAGFGCEMGGAILPSIEGCKGSTEVNFYRGNRANETMFLNLMVRDGAQGNFKVITKNGDSIPIPASWFRPVYNSGVFDKSDNTNRGWWILKDQYKRFGNQAADLTATPPPGGPWPNDGDISNFGVANYGYKNGIPVYLGSVTKVINTEDVFHLGMLTGGPMSSSNYGYFSSYDRVGRAKSEIVETGTYLYRSCFGDTATLRVMGGISYEWFYDPDKMMNPAQFTKDYLEPGKDKTVMCRVMGFPSSTKTKAYVFIVKIKRAVCIGDTMAPILMDVLPEIKPSISFSKTTVCSGDSITITNNTIGADSTKYIWTSFDSVHNVTCNITPVPARKSPFNVAFTIPDDSISDYKMKIRFVAQVEMCAKTLSQNILVHPAVKANFSMASTASCAAVNASFTDSLKGITMTKFRWNFGDGTLDSLTKSPSHIFVNASREKDTNYIVKLNAYNANCASEKTLAVKVGHKPMADFTFDRTAVCSGDTILVTNKTVGADGITAKWKCLDSLKGTWSDINSIAVWDKSFKLTWLVPYDSSKNAKYKVKLNVSSGNCVDSMIKTAVIYPSVMSNFGFTGTGCSSSAMTFSDSIKGVTMTKFKWNFGDGILDSVSIKPIHVFTDLSNENDTSFKVSLRVFNANCSSEKTIPVKIYHKPHASFTIDTNAACSPYTSIGINNKAVGGTVIWTTHDGDGTISNVTAQTNPFRTSLKLNTGNAYRTDTIYQLVNYNFSSGSCNDTMKKLVVIFPASLCPDSLTRYTLTVNSGKGSGSYKKNDVVFVLADSIEHKCFIKWIGDVAYLIDPTAKIGGFVMPDRNASITAVYKSYPYLKVEGGSGSGYYSTGTKVQISAYQPTCVCIFLGWSGDIAWLYDPFAATTTVTMPDTNIAVAANFRMTWDLNSDNLTGIFPNPFHETFSLRFNHEDQSDVFMEIYDMTGKKVYESMLKGLPAGENTISLNAASCNMVPGINTIRFVAGNKLMILKCIYIK